MARWSFIWGSFFALNSCDSQSGSHRQELEQLLAFEDEQREQTDFTSGSLSPFGPDPSGLASLINSDMQVGLLRGEAAIVLLTRHGQELQRLAAPLLPTAIVITPANEIFVAGEGSGEIFQYRFIQPNKIEFINRRILSGVNSIRALALGPEGRFYGLDRHQDRIFNIKAIPPQPPQEFACCHDPIQVKWLSLGDRGVVIVNCFLEHSLTIYPVDAQGMPRGEPSKIQHDGAIWSFDAILDDQNLLIAAGGVEDHPLDRSQGGFGYIDSFLFVYKVRLQNPQAATASEQVAAINLSEIGVITPKWLQLTHVESDAVEVFVTGYGGDQWAKIRWSDSLTAVPQIRKQTALPGITHVSGALAANPLFDAWIKISDNGVDQIISVQNQEQIKSRGLESKLGEALVFTTLMAPWNRAQGFESRFTCETCHFEGHIDGRVHYSGRADIHATTKSLRGLFNNRPHFSRALDRSLTQMVNNEFRVANHHSGHDSWFALEREQIAWLSVWPELPRVLSPVLLRRSLLTFLMQLSHLPNPVVYGRQRWSEIEQRGAELFRQYCEHCHHARLITDDANSQIAWENWENLLMDPHGAIVWASEEYKKTGVLPYVHPQGTRVPSLRRIRQKWPYFTNGSYPSLPQLLAQIRFSDTEFFHDHGPAELTKLTEQEQAALLAFLQLL